VSDGGVIGRHPFAALALPIHHSLLEDPDLAGLFLVLLLEEAHLVLQLIMPRLCLILGRACGTKVCRISVGAVGSG